MAPDDDEDVYVRPMPDPEAMRPHMGRWIAIDENGSIRFFGATTGEVFDAVRKAGRSPGEFSLMFVPKYSFVG